MMTELDTPRERRMRNLTRLLPRRRHLRVLKAARPSRRHVRTALLATAPAAALFGFSAMQPARAPAAATATMPAGDVAAIFDVMAPLQTPRPAEPAPAAVEASYYGDAFAGRRTASGEIFDPGRMTAAHRTLPFGSIVRVTNAVTGKSIKVRINDRGPFHGNREIDLSKAAARKIGMLGTGTAKVVLETLRIA